MSTRVFVKAGVNWNSFLLKIRVHCPKNFLRVQFGTPRTTSGAQGLNLIGNHFGLRFIQSQGRAKTGIVSWKCGLVLFERLSRDRKGSTQYQKVLKLCWRGVDKSRGVSLHTTSVRRLWKLHLKNDAEFTWYLAKFYRKFSNWLHERLRDTRWTFDTVSMFRLSFPTPVVISNLENNDLI